MGLDHAGAQELFDVATIGDPRAAVLCQIGNQTAHDRIVRAVEERATFALTVDDAAGFEFLQMKRKRRCGDVESSGNRTGGQARIRAAPRSEEHTSELQSRRNLVCRPLLEKTKHPNLQPRLPPL